MTNPSGGRRSSSANFEQIPDTGRGRGRGLANLGDALSRVAMVAPAARTWDNEPMTRAALVAAWYRGESDALGLIAAAADEQTAADVRLVENCVRALAQRLADNGRKVEQPRRVAVVVKDASGRDSVRVRWDGGEEWQRAAAAGLAAVVAWRNGALDCPTVPGARVVDAVAVVAWRGVVDELSRDDIGRTVELSAVSGEWLAAAVHPDAAELVAGMETRDDKAARWLRERGQAKRKAALPSQMENLKHGHARRVALVERIETAAGRLLAGDTVDNAARAVGFRDGGGKSKRSAGDALAAAARAVGLNFSLFPPSNRPTVADEFNPYGRKLVLDAGETVAPFVPLDAGKAWQRGLFAVTLSDGSVEWSN